MTAIYNMTSSLTANSGWTDYGASYAGMDVVRSGDLVSIQFLIKPTANIAVTNGALYSIATVPVGFRPLSDTLSPGWAIIVSTQAACRISVTSAGIVNFYAHTTGTMTTANWVGANISYLAA